MLDFGWPELFVIIALAVIFIGPQEIPVVMVGLGRLVRRLNYIKFAISRQFDDVMHEADLDNIRNSVNFEAPEDAQNFDEAEADEDYLTVTEEELHQKPEDVKDNV